MDAAIKFINDIPLAGLMLTVALGYGLSMLKVRGISLGPAGATILVALVLGEFGLTLFNPNARALTPGSVGATGRSVGALGGLLFIYMVGYDAGPDFFGALRSGRGWKFALVGLVIPLAAVGVVLACARLFGLDAPTSSGLLAGAMTSAPSFAASSAALADSSRLAVSFALAYPIGLAGFGVALQVLPRLIGHDLAKGTRSEHEAESVTTFRARARSPELFRTFRVEQATVCGKPLRELQLNHQTGCVISCVRRGGEIIYPEGGTPLAPADVLQAVGRLDELEQLSRLVGPEVYDAELSQALARARGVRVLHAAACGKTLSELRILREQRCVVVRVQRGDEVLEPTADLRIARDDVLEIVGTTDSVRAVSRALGHFESPRVDTNLALFAGGLLLGLIVGSIQLAPLGVEISAGSFGGALVAGILMGAFRRIGRFNVTIPRAARHLIRDFGLLLFVAETGLRAGRGLVQGMRENLWQTLLTATAATLLPMMVGLVVARYLLRLRVPDAWGSIAGGMTSSTLPLLKSAADSNEPAVSFAAAYAAATLLLTIAGQLLIKLM